MNLLTRYLNFIWEQAVTAYKSAILSISEENLKAKMLDLGCDDGEWTLELAEKIGISKGQIFGIDLIKARYQKAIQRGIIVKKSDLNEKFPFDSEYFDFVNANQVIEHIWDLDNFVSEIKRVLKNGGYAIICTESLSSWHNVIVLALGFQPFSLTNISEVDSVGNPLTLKAVKRPPFASWQHTRVLAYEGLKDIFFKHGFKIEKCLGFGYFPLPPFISNILSRIDPRHSAFPVIKVRKIE